MNMGQRIIALIVLLAWVPANCHCLLGALIEDAAAKGCCIESQHKEPVHGQGESGCCDLCGTFESGKFRAPLKNYIDFRRLARDLEYEGYEDYSGHIFRPY